MLEANSSTQAGGSVMPASGNTDGLPPGWEQRFTPAGRPYYVDHT